MLSYVLPRGTTPTHYKPHPRNIKITGQDGCFSGQIAWWADDPIQAAILECRMAIRLLWEGYGINQVRHVVDGNNNEILHIITVDQLYPNSCVMEDKKYKKGK